MEGTRFDWLLLSLLVFELLIKCSAYNLLAISVNIAVQGSTNLIIAILEEVLEPIELYTTYQVLTRKINTRRSRARQGFREIK